MKRKEAIDKLQDLWNEVYNEDSDGYDYAVAIDMAIEALNVKEHDGCDGCRYEANDEYMMPCANCRQNYMDRWTPMPQERCWIPCSERLPETPKHYYDRSLYLTCTKTGYITSIYWWDGWNCTVNEDGTVYRKHEMKDIVAWMELPEPYEDGDKE